MKRKHLKLEEADLIQPRKVWSRSEILVRDSPVPKSLGVYAWYFRDIPPNVPIEGCVTYQGLTLLYVGLSLRSPTVDGRIRNTQTLRHRIRQHYQGNAEASTLRLTLGCLLSPHLRIQLHRVGSGTRMTFGSGERSLSEWMAMNAFVTWSACNEPWLLENKLIQAISLPLNLDQNGRHEFHGFLSELRACARAQARERPIMPAS